MNYDSPIMQAIQVTPTGGAEVLALVDLPAPTPKANEALIEIKASGINFIDVYLREGRYPSPLPFIAGQEAAGVVTEIGSEVTNLKPGDRVAVLLPHGLILRGSAQPTFYSPHQAL